MNSREVALKALYDIEKNKNYSNMAVNKYLKNSDLKDIDRGFATEIIYGVIENKYYLDYIIDKFSKIKSKKMSVYVRILLWIGIYQIMFLNSVSDYAAVNETVNLAKKYDKRSAGFINAILRNVIRNKDDIREVDKKDIVDYLSIKYSYNPWIIQNWTENFGKEFTEELLESNTERPSIYLRTNTLKITRDELIKRLKEQGLKCDKVSLIPEAIKVENLKNIENNDLFRKGYFTIQDVSSMIVGHVLNPKENSLVLDVCSAPGGKTTHVATLMNNSGKIVSRDIFSHKLNLIRQTVDRLGLTNVEIQEFDALKLDEKSMSKFDYVVADVPCSGLGIIRRKPEIKYKNKEEIISLPNIQNVILENASKYVKVGGTLVYSTCTIEDRENIDIVKDFLKNNNNFELEPIENIKIDLDNQEDGYIKIYPNVHGIDGFFIAKLKRTR
jgi:16S rRNA (cytosine967-C5)-methyltransferase